MGKPLVKQIAEELCKVEHKFRAMPDVSEYLYKLAAISRSKEGALEDILKNLMEQGFVVDPLRTMTPKLAANIKSYVDLKLEENQT